GMVIHTTSVVPQSTTTSPSRSAPATSCSHNASTEPAASTVSASRSRPTAAPVCATCGMRSAVAPHSAQRFSLQSVPSYNGYIVPAVAMSTTGSPASAWLATAIAGQYPFASGASRAVQRKNSTDSPERNVLIAPVAPLPRLSPYSRPGVSGLPTSSTPVSDGTIEVTATAVASGLSSAAS